MSDSWYGYSIKIRITCRKAECLSLEGFFMVAVIGKDKTPLMPCSNAIARLLLKYGKAKVKSCIPFTIQLLNEGECYVQLLTHGIDTGSSKIGSAVTDSKANVLYISEIELRNDITDKMKRRSKYRRNRRNRKTRYRKARWLNRKNAIRENRFSPTLKSKIDSHIKEIKFVASIFPIGRLILETGSFDPHALKNPEVLNNKLIYQQGINYGFANVKAYILDRDNYTCQNCKGKSKDSRLHVHHIIFRSNNGGDEPENLITLCKKCHNDVHLFKIKLKLSGKVKGQLKHATQMNVIRNQLLKIFPNAEETYGYITKEHIQLSGLEKTHYNDAAIIAIQSCNPVFKTDVALFKKCISDGDYQQYKGIRSEQKIPTMKIIGFRKFDRVRYNGNYYFIKGRMSSGYAILMDINGEKVNLKPIPKLERMQRISSRKSWIISQKVIVNTYC